MQTLSISLNNDGILSVFIDVPDESMNVMNSQVIEEFTSLLETIEQDKTINAVVIASGKDSGFIAGADIKMLNAVDKALDGTSISTNAQRLLQTVSNLSKPFVAAIDGVCLGAGYELALACDYRMASAEAKTKLGLPEVMIGLLPGATGLTKLPRLIALPTALDLILTGKQLNAKRALKAGMIDEVVPKPILLNAAQQKAKELISSPYQRKPLSWLQRALKLPLINTIVINKARKHVLQKTKGLYPAPLAILDTLAQTLNSPLEEALAAEADAFGKLTVSEEAKQLIHLYFASTALKKEKVIEGNHDIQAVKQLGILGGGLMGSGIATVSIDKANVRVRLKDIKEEGILSAYAYLDKYYKPRIQRRILSKEDSRKKINQLTGSLDYQGFEKADVIIEAVFEDLAIKQQMVADIEALGNEQTIFASNTSSIPLSDIAAKSKRPQNILGMHYFSPVEKMPLLEIIKHSKTSDIALATAVEFGRQQGKTVIVVNDGAGFYVNRILVPYINAAMIMANEGVPFDQIDNALTNAGFPVGPFKLLDEVGIDIGSKIQPILEAAFGERMQCCDLQDILIKHNRLGKKAKKGFYRYDKPNKSKQIDETVYEELSITPNKTLHDKTIVERCMYMMLNEAAYALDEKIINSSRDGDMGAIFGIGFPPFLGGPFRYMDSLSINHVVATLRHYEKTIGKQYAPAQLLVSMAESGKTFY